MAMQYQLQYLVALSLVDRKLDDLEGEFRDLPERIKTMKEKYEEIYSQVKETQRILSENKEFQLMSTRKLEDLKAREAKLSEKQFLVRNNREFDAITKEIEFTRSEYERISEDLVQAKLKEENSTRILEEQKAQAQEIFEELSKLEKEYQDIATNQNEELNEINRARAKILQYLDKTSLEIYQRIRGMHKDAIVKVKKNSCTGCFSHIPPQKIIEMRNNLDKLFTCENCGRLIYPDELEIDSEFLL